MNSSINPAATTTKKHSVPWVVDYEVLSTVCKYQKWEERMGVADAFGVALAYFNNVLGITATIAIFIVKKSGMLEPVDIRA